jgi:hypothetical protein
MVVVQAITTIRRPPEMLPPLNDRILALKVLAVTALIFAVPVAEAFAGTRIP